MKKLVFSLLILLSASTAYAGGSEGYVTTPLAHAGDVFFFSAGTHQGKPACLTTSLGTWAVSLKSESGKAIMSLALAAHAQNKRLHVQGKKTCSIWGDREDVLYALIVD